MCRPSGTIQAAIRAGSLPKNAQPSRALRAKNSTLGIHSGNADSIHSWMTGGFCECRPCGASKTEISCRSGFPTPFPRLAKTTNSLVCRRIPAPTTALGFFHTAVAEYSSHQAGMIFDSVSERWNEVVQIATRASASRESSTGNAMISSMDISS